MKKQRIANALHSLNLKALKKPLAACTVALFVFSMVSIFSVSNVSADSTSMALHTSGQYILDANGNTVYLRGMGLAGFAPNLILWSQDGGDNWGDQWNSNPTAVMDQTFSAMQSQWHINMIRVFVLPSWYYRDNIVPAVEDPANHGAQTTPISTKAYLRTLCEEAGKYGIYVDITPYMLTPSTSSFGADPYASTGYGWQGMPMMGWDDAANRFLSDAGYAGNEQAFWNWFWTDMANNLKGYPNAIFEAWNEPNVGSDADAIPQGYMTYLQTMYNVVRSTGASNLVMMQWHMGWQPNGYGATLGWAGQIDQAIHPTNIAYTTHFYYYAPTDLSSYWASDYSGLKSQIQTGIASMGVNAPLVINEEGSCLNSSPNHQNDLTWWTNLVLAQRDLGVGAGAYYWLSDSGLGGVYSGETMLTGGYSPNSMGQAYINAYNGPAAPAPTTTSNTATTALTPSSVEATPRQTDTTSATQTAATTSQPQETSTQTSTQNQQYQYTGSTIPKATATPTPTATPTATPETLTPINTVVAQPSTAQPLSIFSPFSNQNWILSNWVRYNSWLSVRFW